MTKITLETIGVGLKERRGERGLREVAAEIGISAATLSRIEAGKQPDLETFSKLCKWLELDAGEVLGCGTGANPIETESEISGKSHNKAFVHFRAKREMTPETVNHLSKLILAVQDILEDEGDTSYAEWEEEIVGTSPA